jgi:exosortase
MKTESTTDRTWQEDLRQLRPGPQVLAAGLILVAAFVWFYWGSLFHFGRVWSQDDYQHGPFVPLFSLFLLWYRRDMIIPFAGRGSWWGLAFLGLWAVMRWAAVYFNFGSLPEMSMIPFFAGVALFVGGWQALRWAWPAVVFLAFMLPLPGDVQSLLSLPLQRVAAHVSVYVIQTLGIASMAQGHVIELSGAREPLDVAQACSGLRMMMMFFAMCIGAAFLVRKPLWEKLLIVAAAVPIAVLGNVTRIVVTAIFYKIALQWPSFMDPEKTMHFVHEWAGYLIEMPAGLVLLWILLSLLSKLLISPLPERPLVLGGLMEERAPAGIRQGTRRGR